MAPAPTVMKSRKKARQVTTLFHKYTREKDLAMKNGADANTVTEYVRKIEEIGGREAYQRASQLSTSFHSTSKWVLGVLQRNGWLFGIQAEEKEARTNESNVEITKKLKRKRQRRATNLLEIGAINTELLDAADRKVKMLDSEDATGTDQDETKTICNDAKKYRLDVRAIDLNSMYPGRIEEADFLKLPLPGDDDHRYDVLVCSMVLNCVTTASDRGEMLARTFHFLRPGGLLFLTIPKLCLSQSPYINRENFLKLLGATGVGFAIEDTKESPKVAFFLCRRPRENELIRKFDHKWSELRTIHRGKKFRNQFSVLLVEDQVLGPETADGTCSSQISDGII